MSVICIINCVSLDFIYLFTAINFLGFLYVSFFCSYVCFLVSIQSADSESESDGAKASTSGKQPKVRVDTFVFLSAKLIYVHILHAMIFDK